MKHFRDEKTDLLTSVICDCNKVATGGCYPLIQNKFLIERLIFFSQRGTKKDSFSSLDFGIYNMAFITCNIVTSIMQSYSFADWILWRSHYFGLQYRMIDSGIGERLSLYSNNSISLHHSKKSQNKKKNKQEVLFFIFFSNCDFPKASQKQPKFWDFHAVSCSLLNQAIIRN